MSSDIERNIGPMGMIVMSFDRSERVEHVCIGEFMSEFL